MNFTWCFMVSFNCGELGAWGIMWAATSLALSLWGATCGLWRELHRTPTLTSSLVHLKESRKFPLNGFFHNGGIARTRLSERGRGGRFRSQRRILTARSGHTLVPFSRFPCVCSWRAERAEISRRSPAWKLLLLSVYMLGGVTRYSAQPFMRLCLS